MRRYPSRSRRSALASPLRSSDRSGSHGLTHLDREGRAKMVDVTAKPETAREARARATLRMQPATLAAIRAGGIAKGDVLGVARLAAIMAAKRTADLIPLCHPLPLTSVKLDFTYDGPDALRIEATASVFARTGVEMEVLTAVSIAALTVYDMCKAADRGMAIERVRLEEKAGGASGRWANDECPTNDPPMTK